MTAPRHNPAPFAARMPSEFWREDALAQAAERILGPCGRMISASKGDYRDKHPQNEPVFNGNVCLRSAGKIWCGDLDLTLEDELLQALADEVGEVVYVLNERAARFQRAENPDYADPAGVYEPRGRERS